VQATSPVYDIGDFNNDGNQDLAAVNGNNNSVSIRLGNGTGGFSGTTEVPVGATPIGLAIGDFNGDGKQDIATTNKGNNTVSMRLGDGLGGFSGNTELSIATGNAFYIMDWRLAISIRMVYRI